MRAKSKQEVVAVASSATIIVVVAAYWVTQIMGAIEMLRLAYGG